MDWDLETINYHLTEKQICYGIKKCIYEEDKQTKNVKAYAFQIVETPWKASVLMPGIVTNSQQYKLCSK